MARDGPASLGAAGFGGRRGGIRKVAPLALEFERALLESLTPAERAVLDRVLGG